MRYGTKFEEKIFKSIILPKINKLKKTNKVFVAKNPSDPSVKFVIFKI